MILELAGLTSVKIGASFVALGLVSFTGFKNANEPINDGKKIQRIIYNNGLKVNDNGRERSVRLHRKRKIIDGDEYVFQLPLGIGADHIKGLKQVIEDGLNIKKSEVEIRDFLKLRLTRTIIKDIKKIIKPSHTKAMKEIAFEFDGMMKIRVYDSQLPKRINWQDEIHSSKRWKVCIGKEREGIVFHDFDELPHLIVAGATGFGKSVFMKSMVTNLIDQNPDDVSFTLIDLKEGSAFNRFKDCNQVTKIITEPDDAEVALSDVISNMKRNIHDYVDRGYEDVKEAGITKRHFIVLDEGGELAQASPKAMNHIKTLARLGRGAGYRLVYGTQYPTNETLPSQVRQNVNARLSFVLETKTASLATLDEAGAEALPEVRGRAIYKRVKQKIVQVPYMSNSVIDQKVSPHINIKPRKDESDERKDSALPTTSRKHSLVITQA